MSVSPSLIAPPRRCSHFVSGGGQKVAVVSRHTRACPLVPPTVFHPPTLSFSNTATTTSLPSIAPTTSPTSTPSLHHSPCPSRRPPTRVAHHYTLSSPHAPNPIISTLRTTPRDHENTLYLPHIPRATQRYYHYVLPAIYRPLSTTLPTQILGILLLLVVFRIKSHSNDLRKNDVNTLIEG